MCGGGQRAISKAQGLIKFVECSFIYLRWEGDLHGDMVRGITWNGMDWCHPYCLGLLADYFI